MKKETSSSNSAGLTGLTGCQHICYTLEVYPFLKRKEDEWMGVGEQEGEKGGRKNCDQTRKKYLFILENNSSNNNDNNNL